MNEKTNSNSMRIMYKNNTSFLEFHRKRADRTPTPKSDQENRPLDLPRYLSVKCVWVPHSSIKANVNGIFPSAFQLDFNTIF